MHSLIFFSDEFGMKAHSPHSCTKKEQGIVAITSKQTILLTAILNKFEDFKMLLFLLSAISYFTSQITYFEIQNNWKSLKLFIFNLVFSSLLRDPEEIRKLIDESLTYLREITTAVIRVKDR